MNNNSIWSQLAQNSATILVCRLVSSVISFVSIPIIIRTLGVAGYGVWETVTALCALVSLLQSPINSALHYRASQAYGAGDIRALERLAGIGITLHIAIAIVTLPLFWFGWEGLISIFKIKSDFRIETGLVIPILVTLFVIGGVGDSFAAVLDGCQKTGISAIARTIGQVAFNVTAVIALWLGSSLTSLLWAQISLLLLTVPLFYFIASRQCSDLRPWPIFPNRREQRDIFRYCGAMTIGNLFMALRDQTDKLVFAAFASSQWVGYYAIASRLAGLVLEVSRFVYAPIISAAGALFAQNDKDGLSKLYLLSMTLVGIVTGAITVIVVALHERLFIAWVGVFSNEVTLILLILLAGNVFAVVFAGPGTAICRGTGQVGIELRYVTVSLVVNVALTVVLVWFAGALGTVIASSLAWIAGSIVFIILLHDRTSLPIEATWKSTRIILAVILASSFGWWGNNLLPATESRLFEFCSFLILSIPVLSLYLILLIMLSVIKIQSIPRQWNYLKFEVFKFQSKGVL